MRPSGLRVLARLAIAAAGLTWAGVAYADPVVVVHVRAGRDATVVLRNAHGVIGSCRTENGTCEIRGVPPGQHTVSARTEAGFETPGRPVMIPADGKVSLFVAVPERG